MALLLRKVWESMSISTRSATSESSSSSSSSWSSMGAFEKVPWDVMMMILKLMGPKSSAKMCCVSKQWKSIASHHDLWLFFFDNFDKHLLFAEFNLRSGYPLNSLSIQETQVSLMTIYSQRAQVPASIIIDGGSGCCKYGWSNYDSPRGRFTNFLEFGNIESPMYSRLRHFFGTIYSRMQVKPALHPVVVSVPILHYDDTEAAKASRQQLKDAIFTTLFEMNVPAVCAINQATLALYAARRTSGIVVNIGFRVTSVVPILHGKVMRKVGVEVVGLGALKLTGFLRELMQQNNIRCKSAETVSTLKENLCYVAYDYEAELLKDEQALFEDSEEGWFTLSKERFQTGEMLFKPQMAGVRTMALHHAIALCMDHCRDAELTSDNSWFKTVVLAGGSACLPGLAERLEKELCGLLTPSVSHGINVIPPPYGADTAWFGAKMIGSLSTFPGQWCVTKKQFRQKTRLNRPW